MAVYTEVSDEALEAFIEPYNIGALLSYKGIAEGVENSNYFLHTEAGYFILTLYEKRVDPTDLPFFLGLMDHLSAAGLSCPTPLKTDTGKSLGELAGRPAAIISFLEGMWVRRPRREHCAELGRGMADMHLAGADFPMQRANSLSVQDWRPLYAHSKARAHEVAPDLDAFIEAELDFLEANWPKDLPQGVIHADLFPDNVFFLKSKLSGLIDFYFACTDMLAYDVAICLNAWCFEPDLQFNISKARNLLRAYQKVRPFSDAEFAALPVLARGAALRFLLTRLHDWLDVPEGALVKPKDPMEYVGKLRFHQTISNAGEYGLDQ